MLNYFKTLGQPKQRERCPNNVGLLGGACLFYASVDDWTLEHGRFEAYTRKAATAGTVQNRGEAVANLLKTKRGAIAVTGEDIFVGVHAFRCP